MQAQEPTRLIVVRHAQSENNQALARLPREVYEAGLIADPHLTQLGHRQAAQLGSHLAEETWADEDLTVRTSPMLRTLQTAMPFLVKRGISSQLWRDIHEHGGLYEGVPALGTAVGAPGINRAQLSVHYPAFVPEDDHDRGWWGRDPERDDEYTARVGAVADRIKHDAAATTRPRTLVLVSHGTFLNSLLRALLGVDSDSRETFFHHNAAYSELALTAGQVELVRQDVIDHLNGDLLTR